MEEKDTPEINSSSKATLIFFMLVTLSFLIIAFAGHLITINWGINPAQLLPTSFFYLWLAIAIGVILLVYLKAESIGLYEKFTPYIWGNKRLIGRTFLIIALLGIFVIFRFEAHLLGNGYIRISNFAQRSKPVFRWFEFGGTFIPYILYQILNAVGIAKETAAEWGYQIVSFISGIAFAAILLSIAEIISKEIRKRFHFVLLILVTGLSLSFFGAVEVYSLLLPLAALFVLYLIKLFKEKSHKYLLILWIITVAGLFINLQFITAIPAALYATICYRRRFKGGLSQIGLTLAFSSIIIGALIVYLMAGNSIAIEKNILFFSGKSPEINYGLFSLHHVIDIINLLILMMPLVPVFFMLKFGIMRNYAKDNILVAIHILAAAQFAYLFILDPRIGMAREIFTMEYLLSGMIFLCGYILFGENGSKILPLKYTAIIAPVSFVLILPALAVHLSSSLAVASLDNFLIYNETKYEPALLAMRDYYYLKGNYSEADRREQLINPRAKGVFESQLVNDLYANERVDEAFAYATRLVERDPYNATYRMQLGNLLKHFRKYSEARREFETAIELDPYRADLYHFLSELYREIKMETECLKVLQTAEKVDPENPTILVDLAGYYYRAGIFNRADFYAEQAIQIDKGRAHAYMYKGLISEKNGNSKRALEYYYKFLELGERFPEVTFIQKRINEIELQERGVIP